MIKELNQRDTIISPRILLCIVKQKEWFICEQQVLSISRICVGTNMDVQIPLLVIGRKMFRVMSTHYRTCGVTRLKIIILLSTSLNGSMRNIYRKCSGIFEIVSKDESGNVTSFYGLHTWIYPTRWQPHKRDMVA